MFLVCISKGHLPCCIQVGLEILLRQKTEMVKMKVYLTENVKIQLLSNLETCKTQDISQWLQESSLLTSVTFSRVHHHRESQQSKTNPHDMFSSCIDVAC